MVVLTRTHGRRWCASACVLSTLAASIMIMLMTMAMVVINDGDGGRCVFVCKGTCDIIKKTAAKRRWKRGEWWYWKEATPTA